MSDLASSEQFTGFKLKNNLRINYRKQKLKYGHQIDVKQPPKNIENPKD